MLVLRIDDTDPARVAAGGEEAILDDLAWLGVRFDEGPVRQSERGALYAAAAERALESRRGRATPTASASRSTGTTLVTADGTATYQLATVVDDLELGITHVIRGADHRPNEECSSGSRVALGGQPARGDPPRPAARRRTARSCRSATGTPRSPTCATRGSRPRRCAPTCEELGLPAHDVQLDLPRLHRLAIDAIAAMSDDELAAAAGAPPGIARALRGARTLVEAREIALQILEPRARRARGGRRSRRSSGSPSCARTAADELDEASAREILRELKAVGASLKRCASL